MDCSDRPALAKPRAAVDGLVSGHAHFQWAAKSVVEQRRCRASAERDCPLSPKSQMRHRLHPNTEQQAELIVCGSLFPQLRGPVQAEDAQ